MEHQAIPLSGCAASPFSRSLAAGRGTTASLRGGACSLSLAWVVPVFGMGV